MARTHDRPPQDWRFDDVHREKYEKAYWRCPVRLVSLDGTPDGAPGIWCDLWRAAGTSRGGGSIASVLPVLALHTFPGRELGAARVTDLETWTPWAYLSHRRIARLAGVATETVGPVMRRLDGHGLLETRTVPPLAHFGGRPLREYRLNRSLYANKTEPYFAFSGMLLYGGHWAFLPGGAERHLYVTIACLQAVLNPEAWVRATAGESSTDDAAFMLHEARAKRPLSLSMLERFGGLGRSTVVEALEVLCHPITVDNDKTKRLVTSGPAERRMKWYAAERQDWFWRPEFLNGPAAELDAERLRTFPQLAARRLKAKKARISTKQRRTAANRRRGAIPMART
jgi:hypothetical protein